MLGATTALLALAFLPRGAEAVPAFTPDDFQGWFDGSCEGRLQIPDAVERRARRFRYVFVGGFQNEHMPGYFVHSIKELRARGVPRQAIHHLNPSSHQTLETNLAEIRSAFLAIAVEGPEKLVIIAHSRGACDALAFAIQDEAFVRDRVEALFLVQGPFGGTGVADFVMGEGEPIDHQMPAFHRAWARLMARFELFLMKRGFYGGFPDLTRNASKRFWGRMLEEHPEALSVVGPRTFYVQSQLDPSRQRFFHRTTARYLHTYYGPNDGMVVLDDQYLPGVGTSLGILHAGHTDLTHKFPSTRALRRLRKALIQSILMAVGQEPAAG